MQLGDGLDLCHNGEMNRTAILSRLQSHQDRLRALGVKRLSLFGSVARGEAGLDSDIDLAAQFEDRFSRGGLDYFAKLEALREDLSSVLGRPVDVIEEPVRAARLQAAIERDRVVAFQ